MIFNSTGGRFHKKSTSTSAVFGSSSFSYPPKQADLTDRDDDDDEDDENDDQDEKDPFIKPKYQVVFGSGTLDLTNVDLTKGDVKIKLDCVFGEMKVLIPKDAPIVITSKSVFAETKLPEKNLNAFGEFTYKSDSAKDAPHRLFINANAVFASIRFTER